VLQPFTVPNPAFFGLAKQRQQVALGPEWCTVAENVVIDGAGRLACRRGWARLNSTPAAAAIVQLHEYIKSNGDTEMISSTATKLYSGTATLTEKTGALTITAGNWKFINFNGKCLAWQIGHTPLVYTGTGDFAQLSATSGTLPTGNTALAAFGRVWAADSDGQTLKYSALLDETKWAVADGGGLIDMRSVWTKGMDTIVSIVSYGSALVVMGRRHIIIWTDGSGSELGLNPLDMYVGTILENVGSVARDGVALIGEVDVAFWSSNGVRSLRRTLQEQATPINELSPENRDFLADYLTVGNLNLVRSVYSPKDGFFILFHPSITLCFDVRQQLQDGGYRMTTWTLRPPAVTASINETVYFGFADGHIGQYSGFLDHETPYNWKYESGWMLLPPQDQLKMLKRMKTFLFCPSNRTVTFKWWTDFKPNLKTAAVAIEGDGDEWNIDEWSLMEWSGGRAIHEVFVPLSHIGQYVKVGIQMQVAGAPFAVQSMTLYTRPGRIA
jgi:hypothetical protein